MSAVELLQATAQTVWVAIAGVSVLRARRRPSRSNVDIALFFGTTGVFLVESRLAQAFAIPFQAQIATVLAAAVLALPYLLLRLVRDFGGVRAAIHRAALAGLAVSVALLVITPDLAKSPGALVFILAYFAVVVIYCAARFAHLAATSEGMTRRRMQSVALGSYFLGIAVLIAGIGAVAAPLAGITNGLAQLGSLGAAVSYAIGTAPPTTLKRLWQLPELRAFLGRASTLPRATMAEITDDLAGVAGRALGARATIGMWDEAVGALRFRDPHGALPAVMGPSEFIAWRVFAAQQPMYVADAARAHPENAATYEKAGVGPVLVAPISAGDHRLGVLEVFASREPLFAEDDLEFVQLMAQQAAVVLESRALIDDAARVRAQEETARLKEDFVSAAAHDLKTPLTTIVAQAQLLEMRAEREGRVAELDGIRRLMRETDELSRLVEQILDASRIERGAFPIHLEECDLADLARDAGSRERASARRIEVAAEGPVRGRFDPDRIHQLLENLIDNAIKYSPDESLVAVRAWRDGAEARLSVTDRGIGIPPEDAAHVFERFRRGSNVDHRRFGGIGLGLFICRGIVEQHGGRIWVTSAPRTGTTVDVALPLSPARREAGDDIRAAALASPQHAWGKG